MIAISALKNPFIQHKSPSLIRILILVLISVMPKLTFGQKLYDRPDHLWKPQKDAVYLQEVSTKIYTEQPVSSLANRDKGVYALVDDQIYSIENGELIAQSDAPAGTHKLESAAGEMWLLASGGLYRMDENKWTKLSDLPIVDLAVHNGELMAATREEIFRVEGDELISTKPEGGYYNNHLSLMKEDGTQVHVNPVRLGPIDQIESFAGMLMLLKGSEIASYDGKKVDGDYVDWGFLPSTDAGEMLRMGSRVFVTTDKGLGVLRGAALTSLTGKDGLPYENTTCLAAGFDDDLWIGTTRGAVRMLDDDWHYFGAENWVPGDHVNDIVVSGKKVVIATDKGIGIIDYEPFTLQKKADYYEHYMDEWGMKRAGYISTLRWDDGAWIRLISDNDGGHLSTYLAAMSFKYAVTQDAKDREEAIRAFRALLWLERVTPIDGFIARAVWTEADKDEPEKTGSGGWPAKWYKSKDGNWMWKGDTSSDEVIAHIYAMSIFHDLVAEGREKVAARDHIAKIVSYIMENDWRYVDLDGETTRWGRWYPEYLLRDYGYVDKGINGLEALAFVQAAYDVTGDQKYKTGLAQLVEWRYPQHAIRQKHVFPPQNVAPWDDRHAFRAYYTLIRNTEEPDLKALFLRSLERTYEIKRIERTPWYNFSYGVITGNDCEQDQSMKSLRAWPLDCRRYSYHNSHRDDLFVPDGYVSYEKGRPAISPRERPVKKGVGGAYEYDGNSGGNVIVEPVLFLREYWMGRYHGLIEAPETDDKKLISVDRSEVEVKGAKPFEGPEIPDLY
jgi:hypothetical protein